MSSGICVIFMLISSMIMALQDERREFLSMLSAFALIFKSPLLLLRAMQQPKKKVRNIIGMFAVFLCVSGAASAAGVHAVPASRISVRLPAGMVAQAHTSDGSLNLTIDSQKRIGGVFCFREAICLTLM